MSRPPLWREPEAKPFHQELHALAMTMMHQLLRAEEEYLTAVCARSNLTPAELYERFELREKLDRTGHPSGGVHLQVSFWLEPRVPS